MFRASLLVAAAVTLSAQDRPKFDITSVKPSQGRIMNMPPITGGRMTVVAPVRLLILEAYGLPFFRITGGPAWIDSDFFSIEATAEGNPSQEQGWLMLQSLLEERFLLKVRPETRELPVYVLLPAKGGLKLQAGEAPCVTPIRPSQWGCGAVGTINGREAGRLKGQKVTMEALSRTLGTVFRRHVIDRTGFTGTFDVDFEFHPDQATAGMQIRPALDPNVPSIFTAIQEKLGLRLEATKWPVEILVIESVEKPAAN